MDNSNTIGSVKSMRSGREKFRSTSSRKSTSISSCLAWIPQFFVLRRSSDAFSIRMMGGYDSLRKKRFNMKEADAYYKLVFDVGAL
jgi:hypothetical protein